MASEIPTIFRINGQLYRTRNGHFTPDVAVGQVVYLSVNTGHHYRVVEVRSPNPESGDECGLDPQVRIIEVKFFKDGGIDQVCREWTVMLPLGASVAR